MTNSSAISSFSSSSSEPLLSPDNEVTRTSMRISMASWSKQEANTAQSMDDYERLKQHILLCPFVSPDSSHAVKAALKGLENSTATESKNSSGRESPVATEPEDEEKPVLDRSRRGGGVMSIVGLLCIFRTLLLESPIVILCILYLSTVWMHRVADMYLRPMGENLSWGYDQQRPIKEQTFYARTCEAQDMTTSNPLDLVVPPSATPQEAMEHQLEHGVSIFRGVLSDETATNLRKFIVDYNKKMNEEESIFLISQKNRYSFGLGVETPEVARAMEELANHPQLSAALEEIIGPNPALIEMTGITSNYGADDQHWHDDVVPDASVIQYGRTFGPSYSIFTQLQNTTARMGATGICPGTHVCPFGAESYCPHIGFQIETEPGYWASGDTALMNMNTWHRGAAHTDPDALERVMLVLTFVPRPQTHGETRQMSQGITFSLRWDMWGHCLNDLKHAAKAMWRPLAVLRALGLYKLRDADWGIDYITSATMRMASEDNGFRRDELDVFLQRGGIKWLPKFLHGDVQEDENFPEYYYGTILKTKQFLRMASAVSIVSYLVLYFLASLALSVRASSTGMKRLGRFGRALFRLGVALGLVFALFKAANHRVDSTQWARDIREGRLYDVSFTYGESDYEGPTTFPYRYDVLIEQRYGSDYLAMYNDYVNMHPGNKLWRRLVRDAASTYKSYPPMFRNAYASYIVSSIYMAEGRFLYQDRKGNWIWMEDDDAIERTRFELELESNDAKKALWKGWRHLLSECKFGHIRDAALTQEHIVMLLFDIREKLFPNDEKEKEILLIDSDLPASSPSAPFLRRTFVLSRIDLGSAKFERRPVDLHVGTYPDEPLEDVWTKSGDIVEVSHREADGTRRWYPATVKAVSSSKFYSVVYHLDENNRATVEPKSAKRFVPPEVGDRVEVLAEGAFHGAKVAGLNQDGSFSAEVYVNGSMVFMEQVTTGQLRRGNKSYQV